MLKFVHDLSSWRGKAFNFIVYGMILFTSILFSVSTHPSITPLQKASLETLFFASSVFFLFEYVIRIIAADKATSYIFSFYGFFDFLAIIPLFVGILASLQSLQSLQSLRLLRFLRLLSLVKLFKLTPAFTRLAKAFKNIKSELTIFLIAAIVLIYLSAVGIFVFENAAQPEVFNSIFDSLWWAVATLTTVGYGDIYPITIAGRVFTIFIVFIGLGIISIPAALLSSELMRKQ
ncbi:MAG: ion transporter [Verrucomicrobia bacterium]|nr:ion transporter [Verrucomicrobiota bacterium]